MGIDVAGTVESVGKNVTGFKVGDCIFGSCLGSHAEYVRVRQSAIIMMPKNSTFQEAATIPTAALTVLQALSGFSCSQTESTPAHTPLTQTVGRSDLNLFKEQKYVQPSEHSSYVTRTFSKTEKTDAEKNTMKKVLAGVFTPSIQSLVRGLRFCAAAVALHGVLLGLFLAAQSLFPDGSSDLIGEVGFFVLTLPALFLTSPFYPILWYFGLMDAPGWFAWPKPLGIALAYMMWVVVLLGLAQAVQRWRLKK